MKKTVDNHRRKPLGIILAEKKTLRLVIYIIALLIWVSMVFYVMKYLVGGIASLLAQTTSLPVPYISASCDILLSLVTAGIIILTPKWMEVLLPKITHTKKKHLNQKVQWKSLAKELGLTNLPTWTDIGLAPIGYIVYVLLALAFESLFGLFPWFNANETQDVGFSYFTSKPELIFAFFALVVVAPIAEEIIFRGYLYGKLREKTATITSSKTSTIISILLVSLLFGVAHGQWNVGVNVFALSIILCMLREITGTIHAGILLHMLKNGIAFYLVYVLGMGLL